MPLCWLSRKKWKWFIWPNEICSPKWTDRPGIESIKIQLCDQRWRRGRVSVWKPFDRWTPDWTGSLNCHCSVFPKHNPSNRSYHKRITEYISCNKNWVKSQTCETYQRQGYTPDIKTAITFILVLLVIVVVSCLRVAIAGCKSSRSSGGK